MLTLRQNFFVDQFLVENRANNAYNYFIDTYKLYCQLFDGVADIMSILSLPYPLYNDIILSQIEEKKKNN